jgi:hypothetical protein
VDEVPRNSVGKHEKKLLRERYAEGDLNVMISGTAASQAGGASQPADAPAVEAPPASEPPAGTPAS